MASNLFEPFKHPQALFSNSPLKPAKPVSPKGLKKPKELERATPFYSPLLPLNLLNFPKPISP
ncbi:MAG: hypothetical protein DHS20C18_18270 [Saprospiraceae bacterium]|nr:MAG: hypothetical protein DHS20C18_18270 [Saprospiraceae bacterium]